MFPKLIACSLLVASAMATIPDYVPDELKEVIENLHTVCYPKNGITQEEVDNYKITDNSHKMMCYMKCMLLESNWMLADGTLNKSEMFAIVNEEFRDILENFLSKCSTVPEGSHECEKAYNFHVCAQAADPVHYFLP